MTEIQFDRCECDDPAEDELLMRFPDGESVRVVACDVCGEAVEWDRSHERDADGATYELPAGAVLEGVPGGGSTTTFSDRFAVELALEER